MANFGDILINPKTAGQLGAFLARPPHGLLLTGGKGSGKKHLARLLAVELLGATADKIDSHPYFFRISKEDGKSEISIDSARRLVKKLSLRVVSENHAEARINRIAVIEDAGLMSLEAQNAVLKMLEEPPAGSLIILTAGSANNLLPTVTSRLQRVMVLPAGLPESLEFFFDRYAPKDIETAWRLSQGAPALMDALLDEAAAHPLKKAVEQAKELLRLNTYQRLIFLQGLAKDKAGFFVFLEALSKVLAALHETSINNRRQSSSAKLLNARKLVNRTLGSAEANVNLRLLALALAVDIPI